MKKLINLIALVMLVSTNVLTPFSYAQEETPEVIPENEVENVEEIGENPEKDNEITVEILNSLGEVEGEGSLPLVRDVVNETSPAKQGENLEGLKEEVEDSIDAVESPAPDEDKDEDTEKGETDEVAQSEEENAEIEKQEEKLEGDELEEELGLQKIDEPTIMQVESGTSATLLPGQEFNATIKRLAGETSATYSTTNTTINQIIQWTGDTIPSGVTTTGLSTSDSEKEIIAWYDDGIIYYYTEAETIYLNPDSSYMFYYMQGLTGLDLSSFDTSDATNMYSMFRGCSSLEKLNLNGWYFVGDMEGFFSGLTNLKEINLNGVDTMEVTNMSLMFEGCSSLTKLDLSSFDTDVYNYPRSMFNGCSKLEELSLSGWDFRKTDTSNNLFGRMGFVSNSSLKKIDLTNAKFSGSLDHAFGYLIGLEEIKLNGIDMEGVTDMGGMFQNCSSLKGLDLSNFNTSNVTDMSLMFYGCSSLTGLDLSSLDISNVTNMGGMFSNCSKLEELNMRGLDFSNLTSMSQNGPMQGASYVKKLNMENAKFSGSMSSMFNNLISLEEINLKGANTEGVTDMGGMFQNCSSLTGLDLSSWDTSNVNSMIGMFNGCNKLEELNMSGWKFNGLSMIASMTYGQGIPSLKKLDLTNTKYTGSMAQSFKGYTELEEIKLEGADTSSVTDMGQMFQGCSNLTGLDLSNFDTSNVINMGFGNGGIFGGCNRLEELNLSGWNFKGISNNQLMMYVMGGTPQSLKKLNMTNTKYTGSASYAFGGLTKLEELNLDGADTRGVTNMNTMFNGDSKLKYLDLSNFDTSNVTNMGGMFSYCSSLTGLDLSSFDTSKVTNMGRMFSNCSSLTGLDLSNFDTSNVSSAVGMFDSCNKLEELNMSGWKFNGSSMMTSMTYGRGIPSLKKLNLTNTKYTGSMAQSFRGYTELEEIKLEGADTSNVTDMADMFYGCSNLSEIDLSNWDTRNVTKMGQMFYNTPNLKTIYASDNFVTSALTGYDASGTNMFYNSISIVGGNGTKFDSGYTDKTYAKIDKVGQTGYFTDKNAINVKFINTLDGTETTSTFAKGQKLTPPYVDKYHVVGGYLDEEMTQAIDLNKGVDSYSVIYIKYERNGSSGGGGGGGGSSKKTDEDTHGSAEDSQKNSEENAGKEIPPVSPLTEGELEQPQGQNDASLIKGGADPEVTNGKAEGFTPEFQQAYTFAKENGITTKDTIQSAQMNGKLTRIAMAKMLSQYAINVLGQTPDTSKTIKFKDVSNKKDADYDNGVTLAYQLGIMGQNMPNNRFRPNDEVSRAEFVTALSRLLYQTTDGEYKSTSKYYTPHMAKLYNEGIINNTDPGMKERRGYVMIMLMRSVK